MQEDMGCSAQSMSASCGHRWPMHTGQFEGVSNEIQLIKR